MEGKEEDQLLTQTRWHHRKAATCALYTLVIEKSGAHLPTELDIRKLKKGQDIKPQTGRLPGGLEHHFCWKFHTPGRKTPIRGGDTREWGVISLFPLARSVII